MNVFISYSTKDLDTANRINNFLKTNGISVWMAPGSIPAGSNYTKEIPRAIKACDVFILILSRNAIQSPWVPAEIENAYKKGKKIIPYAIENYNLPDDFDFLLSRSQRILAYEDKCSGFAQLLEEVQRSPKNSSTNPTQAPISQPHLVSKKSNGTVTTGQIKYNAGSVYEGDLLDGTPHGHGTLTWPEGHVYKGDFVNGKRSGKGSYTWPNGDVYEGTFVDNSRTGKGKLTFANGTVYEGDFVNGAFEGIGTYTWPSGASYKGDFINGKRTGKGTLLYSNGESYTGDFVNGELTGKGVMTYKNGTVYEGDFINGKKVGQGKLTKKNGDICQGSFVDDQYTGQGKILFKNGNIYEGNIVSGDLTGEGKYTFKNGDYYIGTFIFNRFYDGIKYDKTGKRICRYRFGIKTKI